MVISYLGAVGCGVGGDSLGHIRTVKPVVICCLEMLWQFSSKAIVTSMCHTWGRLSCKQEATTFGAAPSVGVESRVRFSFQRIWSRACMFAELLIASNHMREGRCHFSH